MGTPWGWRLFLSADPELSSVLAVDYASDAVKKTTARVGELGMMTVLASRDVGGLAALWRQVGAVLPGRMLSVVPDSQFHREIWAYRRQCDLEILNE